MSLHCLIGRHRPMLNSIIRREGGFTALCDSCSAPIERTVEGSWTRSESLLSKHGQTA